MAGNLEVTPGPPPQPAPPAVPEPPLHTPAEPRPAEGPQERGSGWRIAAIALAALVVVALVLLAAAGEAARFFSVGIQFVPIAVLGALAFLGLRNAGAAVVAYVWLAFLGMGVLLLSLGYSVLPFVSDFVLLRGYMGDPELRQSLVYDDLFKPGLIEGVLFAVLLLLLVTLLALSMLLRPVRVFVARFTRIDPDNFVHKIALVFLTLVLFSSLVPLVVLGGRAPLLELVVSGAIQGLGVDITAQPQDLVYQLVWMVPTTMVAAGWLTRRRLGETLVRLGVVRPTWAQAALGVGVALVMAVVSMFALDPGIRSLWQAIGWPTTDVEAFGRIMANLITPLGAALVGITAGVGEEMAVRGLLQPRIGLILSNLVFTAFHAYQYGPDALLSVFVVGLALGVLRHYTNTTTSAIAHAVYNFTLVMSEVLAGG